MSSDLLQSPIDATTEVVTPENIAVHYRVAGPVRRALAFGIDLTIFWFVLIALWFVLMLAGSQISGGLMVAVALVCTFLLWWFYFGAQEWYFRGRTAGKFLLGLRVITVEGQPINGLQAVMRALLRLPDFTLPIVDLITMSLNDQFQRLGDIVCGTVVVFDERSWLFGVAKLDDPRAVQLASYVPPEFEIQKSLAKALATYVERRKFFSPPRRKEVARHLAEPLLKRFGLPADTSYDLLLCALYYRAFIADRGDDEEQAAAIATNTNPFVVAAPQPAYGYGGMQATAGQPAVYYPNSGMKT